MGSELNQILGKRRTVIGVPQRLFQVSDMLLRFGTAASQRANLGQISLFLTPVKLGEGWAKFSESKVVI